MLLNVYDRLLKNSHVTNEELVNMLMKIGVFKQILLCPKNCGEMSIVKQTRSWDGYIFQCKMCYKRTSVRTGSLLFKSRMQLIQILSILVSYANNQTTDYVSRRYCLDIKTVKTWYSTFRKLISKYMDNQFQQLGGEGKSVEIDEAVIGRRKYNRGRIRQQQWVFGCIERGTSNIFIQCVDNRTKATLGELIKDVIAEDTLIFSDEWPAYMSFFGEDNSPYAHLSVNHSENFVDPLTQAHTQNIECVWGRMRRHLRSKNYRNKDFLKFYLDEFCFKEWFKHSANPPYYTFEALIKLL